jgi:predicted helicase
MGFQTHDRGKLIMACGTGKTFTALKIAEKIATEQKAKPTSVLFLVPSISLLNQSLREWTNEAEVPRMLVTTRRRAFRPIYPGQSMDQASDGS